MPCAHQHSCLETTCNCQDAAHAPLWLMLIAHAHQEVPLGHLRLWRSAHAIRDATCTPGRVADRAGLAILAWHHGTRLEAQDVCHGTGLSIAKRVLALQQRGRPEALQVRKTALCMYGGPLLQMPASRCSSPRVAGILCCPTCEAAQSSGMGAMPSSPCCSPCVPALAPAVAPAILVRLPPATDCRLPSGDGGPARVDPEAAAGPCGVNITAGGTRPGPFAVELGLADAEPPAEPFGLRAAKDWRRDATPFREGEWLSAAATCMDPQVCRA